jgi:integrase
MDRVPKMEWGDITPLRTKTIRLLEGDLFVLVVNKYGLQTDNANLYCSIVLRPTSMALATMQAKMDAVCQFQNWCGDRGIAFLQRLASGEYFDQSELAALREELHRNLTYRPTKGRPPPDKRRKRSERPNVENGHWRNRCVAVRDYVAWFAEGVIQRLPAGDDKRAPDMKDRLASFKHNIVAGIRVRTSPMREGLDEEEEVIFLKAITPGDPSNPFAPRNQIRNHALWLTYFDGGLRLGEGLGLYTTDCHLNGPKKELVVHRRPDNPKDPRRKKALAKTLPHPVRIGRRLTRVLHDFIVNHRPSYPGARRSPYLFPSEDGGPLTHATVAYMYARLRERVPGMPEEFSTNDARRAWNNRFADAAEQAGLSAETSAEIANHAQGRIPTSKQAEAYRTRHNRKKADDIMLRMQDEDTGASSEVTE